MQYKSFRIIDIKADEQTGIFEGYASVFGNKDSYGDVVTQGAFTKTLQERKDKIKVLWQHNSDCPIGKPIDMYEDSRGLYVKAKISDTTLGRDCIKLLKDGVIGEMSIGYSTVKENWDNETKTNYLNEVKLYEFSLVTFPANELARVTEVKQQSEVNQKLCELLDILKKNNEPSSDTHTEDTQDDQEPTEVTQDNQEPSEEVTDNEVKSILEEIKKYQN